MSLGTVQKYNQFPDLVLRSANRQWDDPAAGSAMFILATSTYTPSPAHSTAADLGANVITTGNGSPINVATPVQTLLANVTWFSSGGANFGNPVTITAKYLVCVQPVVAGNYAATAKLLWYVDLSSGGGSLVVSAGSFNILPPVNGWVDIT